MATKNVVGAEPELGADLLTVREAAAYLRIAHGTLKNWISQGRFGEKEGLMRVGRRILIRKQTLTAKNKLALKHHNN